MIYEVTAVAAVLVAGLYVSTRRAYLAELRDRARRLEREHDQTSALAAAVERARIAREMHDSVAHHLTVIVALSDGALAAVNRAPAQACDAIRGVSSTAREALAETRRLLGILRTEGGLELRQPLPGLSDLDGLFTRVRAAGLPVRYERSGPPGDTPPGVQLVVFRLVQEALTNTMKHAGPGASAAVRLRLEPDEVRVEVTDDGVGSAGVPRAPGGGLTGMAERVGAFDGELTEPASLVAAIRTIAAGDAGLAPTATTRLVHRFAASPEPGPAAGHPAAQLRQALTSREHDVFVLIAAGMSNSEIAASLFLSEGTVKIHVGRILAKLGLCDRVQAVVLAYESGVITPGTPPSSRPD